MSEQSYGKVCQSRSSNTYRNAGKVDEEQDRNDQKLGIHNGNGVYINLLANPEGYTGYGGPSAHRVWAAIQHENCFLIDESSIKKSIDTHDSFNSQDSNANEAQVNLIQCTEKSFLPAHVGIASKH